MHDFVQVVHVTVFALMSAELVTIRLSTEPFLYRPFCAQVPELCVRITWKRIDYLKRLSGCVQDGLTALHCAANWDHLPIVEFFVDKGAFLDATTKVSFLCCHCILQLQASGTRSGYENFRPGVWEHKCRLRSFSQERMARPVVIAAS